MGCCGPANSDGTGTGPVHSAAGGGLKAAGGVAGCGGASYGAALDRQTQGTEPSFSDVIAGLPAQSRQIGADLALWLRTDSLEALIAVAVGTALLVLLLTARGVATRWLNREAPRGSWRWVAARVVGKTGTLFLAVASARAVTSLSDAPEAWASVIRFVFTVVAALQLASWVRTLAVSLVERRAAGDEEDSALDNASGVLRVLISVAVWVLVVILLLDNLGVNVTALVAGLGIGGIAIGLAAQGIFADLFAAIAILLDRPFRRHDTISFGPPNTPTTGTVEQIGLKTTRLRSPTGEEVVVSNTKLLADQIRNLRRIETRTVTIQLFLDLESDVALLRAVPGLLEAAAADVPGTVFKRAAVSNITPQAFECELVIDTEPDYATMVRTRETVLLGAVERLRGAGLHLAHRVA